MTDLDPSQSEAVERAMGVVERGGTFKLLGKAGTGKTTTGLAIVDAIKASGRPWVAVSYTNKAVTRMRQIGYEARHTRTIHRLMYQTVITVTAKGVTITEQQADKILRAKDAAEADQVMSEAGVNGNSEEDAVTQRLSLYHALQRGLARRDSGYMLKDPDAIDKDGIGPETVVIVDELSMVPLDAADDIIDRFNTVIFIGDPGQLPPVNSVDTVNHLATDDQFELTTVHRVGDNQDLLGTIHQLDAGKIPDGVGAVPIERFDDLTTEGYQFIAYTNNAVAWMNERARHALGLSGEPVTGEKLVTVTRVQATRTIPVTPHNEGWFLENELMMTDRGAVYETGQNGKLASVMVKKMFSKNTTLETMAEPDKLGNSDMWHVSVTEEGDPDGRVWLISTLPFWDMTQARKRAFRNAGQSMRLDFAYAITAHKAQGSEWPRVAVVLRQVYRRDRGNGELIGEIRRWNYTAGTRARENLHLMTSIIGCPYG